MGNVISNLKAKFGVDSSDFKKGLKDGEKAVAEFKGAAGDHIEQFASMFGINMGGVSDAIGTAGKALNFVGQSFKGASGAGAKFAITMNVVKLALISSGIGALVVALGSVVAYFQKSGKGADQFARVLAQVKSVINNVIDRLALFGKGVYEIATGKFKQGWETMKGAFQGIGKEITEDWKASGILADRLDELDDKEIRLITSLEERRAKAAELRLMAKEEVEDQKKNLSMLNEAEALYKSVYGDLLSIERERLDIMKEQLAISAKDPTDEQRREIAEQEAKISALLRQQTEELKALNGEKKTATEAVREELELEKLKASAIGVTAIAISNIQMPDLGKITTGLQAPIEAVKGMMLDVTDSVNSAFESMAEGLGTFLGALAAGDAGAGDFVKVIGGVFADLAITVGRICIAAGVAKMALEKALITFGGAGFAIASGIALVALGTAVKGSMSSAVGAGGGSSSFSSGAAGISAGAAAAQNQSLVITLKGKLVAEGKDLVYVVDQENIRRNVST